ncbi:Hypothetical predicted protein [Olea europaea subsp. europaea]|uniref:Uncharacterized protein n=1 Tax=Olea europaea subsp. europaea TaxID=158383 RepID=A0A8S0SNL6_OLEEU|nr:Hypothetical predicted protein [Olea europaea subsp. europaea]
MAHRPEQGLRLLEPLYTTTTIIINQNQHYCCHHQPSTPLPPPTINHCHHLESLTTAKINTTHNHHQPLLPQIGHYISTAATAINTHRLPDPKKKSPKERQGRFWTNLQAIHRRQIPIAMICNFPLFDRQQRWAQTTAASPPLEWVATLRS